MAKHYRALGVLLRRRRIVGAGGGAVRDIEGKPTETAKLAHRNSESEPTSSKLHGTNLGPRHL